MHGSVGGGKEYPPFFTTVIEFEPLAGGSEPLPRAADNEEKKIERFSLAQRSNSCSVVVVKPFPCGFTSQEF